MGMSIPPLRKMHPATSPPPPRKKYNGEAVARKSTSEDKKQDDSLFNWLVAGAAVACAADIIDNSGE